MTSNANILVIGENDVTRKMVAAILQKQNYNALEARTANDATMHLLRLPLLAIVDAEGNDFSDNTMLMRLPTILLTEEQDTDALMARTGLPRATVLQKPFTADMLTISIDRTLAGVRPVGETASADEHETFMRRAIDLSQEKMDENCGGPFGAVIVREGKIIAEGWNQVTSTHDPTAHAEMVAIRSATKALGHFSLEGCEIYTSCEPCPMCLSAIYWAHLDRIYYANTREDAEAIGFDDDFIYRELAVPQEKRMMTMKIMLRDEAQVVFQAWMRKKDKVAY